MQSSGQQSDASGLIERLRRLLGPAVAVARPSAALFAISAEDLPGLYLHVAPDGAILSVSKELAETLAAGDTASVRGHPIATCLPAMAPGSPLCQEVREKGAIRNIPIQVLALTSGVRFPALLSARRYAGDGITPGAWMGCLTLLPAEDHHGDPPTGVNRELLDGLRGELRSQVELLALQFPCDGGADSPNGLSSLVRMYLGLLPRLEAILLLDTPSNSQAFDAGAAVAEICRTAGRLLDRTGVSLIFDADPAFPARVAADENRLRTCLSLLLGAVFTRERPAELVVRLAYEDAGSLSIEVGSSPASGPPIKTGGPDSDFELSKMLAATADGAVSVELGPPICHSYLLRMPAPEPSPLDAAIAPSSSTGTGIDRALQGLRVLCIGLGEAQRTIFSKWLERQHAGFLHASASWEVQTACGGVRPDVAVVDLSSCSELPEFLRDIPVLGLVGAFTAAPDWCGYCIEKPILEGDLLESIGSLHPRSDPAQWEPQGSRTSNVARILAVDDNPVNLRIIQKMLIRLGHEVDLASSGLDALAALRQRPHDAVLMDWEMPVMDGLETTAAIRQLPEPLCRIPIIAVTAHALAGDRETCLRGGMDDYLSKPVKVETLSRMLGVWLPRSPRLLQPEG